MELRVLRQACCAADDQLGPLDAVFHVDPAVPVRELIGSQTLFFNFRR